MTRYIPRKTAILVKLEPEVLALIEDKARQLEISRNAAINRAIYFYYAHDDTQPRQKNEHPYGGR